MRGGQPTQIKLSEGEQQELEAVTRRHRSAQQLVLRARIVLLANEGKNNKQIAQALAITEAGSPFPKASRTDDVPITLSK